MNEDSKTAPQLLIPTELLLRLSTHQQDALRRAWSESFVTPYITQKLAEELGSVIPQLRKLTTATADALQKVQSEFGLAFLFLDRRQSLDTLTEFLRLLSEDLSYYLDPNTGEFVAKELTGRTKGNRAQVEFNQFVFQVAEILKNERGVPWDDVMSLIQHQAKFDSRIYHLIGSEKSESKRELLRARWNRHRKSDRTQVAERRAT